MICPGDPHQRKRNAPQFEDRSQEETEWQEQGAREAAWKLANSVLKLQEHERATFFSPSENWCLRASTLKLEERDFVVDSGASMHMISEKASNSAELETVTTSRSPTTVITPNGEVETNEEATVYVRELDIFLTMKVLEDTPAVLSLWKLCVKHGYSYEWINGQKPHLIKNGIRVQFQYGKLCTDRGSWNIYNSFKPIQQPSQVKVWIEKHGETRSLRKHQKSCYMNQPKSQNQIKMRITNRYGETRIPTYQNGCKKSEKISWMTEFLNTETHTRVLLMKYL